MKMSKKSSKRPANENNLPTLLKRIVDMQLTGPGIYNLGLQSNVLQTPYWWFQFPKNPVNLVRINFAISWVIFGDFWTLNNLFITLTFRNTKILTCFKILVKYSDCIGFDNARLTFCESLMTRISKKYTLFRSVTRSEYVIS